MQKRKRALFTVSGIVCSISIVALTLYACVVAPSMGMWFYRWQYRVNNTYANLRMEPEHLHEVTRHMIRYLNGLEDSLQIRTIINGEERYFFSPLEIRHMEDVRWLFQTGRIAMWVFLGLFIASAIIFIVWGRKQLRFLWRSIQITTLVTVLTMAGLVAAIFANWNQAFIVFHEVLFDNDYWILDRGSDLMLTMVPYDFFIAISIFIGATFGGLMIKYFGISTFALWYRKRKTAHTNLVRQKPTNNPTEGI